jgi:carboxymethylenebutenolidase
MPAVDLTVGPQSAPVPAVVARPAEARAGVVVLQEAFGVTSHIRSICERLAAAGYLAVGPALYHREGAPVIDYSRMDLAHPLMAKLRADDLKADIASSAAYLNDAGFQAAQVAILGFCLGGSVALYAATVFDFGAAVTFYGGGVSTGRFGMPPLQDLGPAIRCPWLGLFGAQDHTIPPEDVDALRSAVAKSPADTELVCYPTAGHGFNCDERASFVPSAAADAWQRTLAFLDGQLSG